MVWSISYVQVSRCAMADGRQSTGGFCGELAVHGRDRLQNSAKDRASVSRVPGQVQAGECPHGAGGGITGDGTE